ncbi:hypothetical protein ACFLQN_03565 [Candidatus Aenigmatarchaeota archaeon]
MTDEFVIFLVIGLIALAALIVVTNADMGFYDQQYQEIPYQIVEQTETGDVRFVGIYAQDASRFETMEIALGSDEFDHELGNKELYSGALFGDNEFIFEVTEETDTLEISFKVVRTNSLAPLIIKMNGDVIERRVFNLGEYTFTINGPIESGTKIEIVPESSTWKIWAPNLYELSEIKFSTTTFARTSKGAVFSMLDEYDYFKEARVEFITERSYGAIDVVLNGETIYHGALSDIHTIQFGKDKIIKGENKIEFIADEQSVAIGTINLIIFYEEQEDHELSLPFTIENYETMVEGIVTFDIVDVYKSGGFSVKITSGSETLLQEYSTAYEQQYTVYFNKDNVNPGTNRVVIHQIEGSSFEVANINVQIR